ncbi:transglycosylase SLT domain-containing protein [Paenarthrobacter sp. Z7-10]|uniref:CHAP domain-containing protein n=1 Tax=Paenarthrobacter sp. Z7-10 TaxID=2787635 RepID=UPI0022A9CA8E|nr:CHAP domain-containing protein [Paenarthrobacter sp. Z7-10]MCZ2403554.1 transglycosylase SLT domain-containing protein [Paenarthrobacter sp. Z7-10]
MRKGFLVLTAVSLPVIFLAALLGMSLLGAGGSSAAACPAAASSTEPVKAGTIPNGWAPLVQKAATDSGVPSSVLAAQLEAESGWNPKAVSPAGAQGLSQFIPGTWASYGGGKDPFDPEAAIAAQGAYMKALVGQVGPLASSSGQPAVSLALAGYNAGVGRVFQYGGIPPYAETQNYVAKILASAQKYAQNGDTPATSVAPPASCTGLSVSNAAVSTAGDDYPWKTTEHNANNPVTGFAYRNCTDFAWWRTMGQLGITDQSKMNATRLGPGDGGDWGLKWQQVGWTVSKTPKVGAVIWYARNANGVGSYGHVAIVKEITADGKVVEEGYNFGLPPTGQYYTRTIDPGYPSGYLYIPTKEQAAAFGLAA